MGLLRATRMRGRTGGTGGFRLALSTRTPSGAVLGLSRSTAMPAGGLCSLGWARVTLFLIVQRWGRRFEHWYTRIWNRLAQQTFDVFQRTGLIRGDE